MLTWFSIIVPNFLPALFIILVGDVKKIKIFFIRGQSCPLAWLPNLKFKSWTDKRWLYGNWRFRDLDTGHSVNIESCNQRDLQLFSLPAICVNVQLRLKIHRSNYENWLLVNRHFIHWQWIDNRLELISAPDISAWGAFTYDVRFLGR